jgi:hypothetical protein
MSYGAIEQSRGSRGLCQACRDRKARFRFRGEVRADRDHTLCFECFRSQRDRVRAATLAEVRTAAPLRSPFTPVRPLTPAQVEHRHRMLSHLHRVSCGATG